jgi:hypothetical protein
MEELLQFNACLVLVLLESDSTSLKNSFQDGSMFLIQHGETITPSFKIQVYPKEFTPTMTPKLEDLISTEWSKLFLMLPQDQLFFFTHALTIQPVLTPTSINGDKLPLF